MYIYVHTHTHTEGGHGGTRSTATSARAVDHHHQNSGRRICSACRCCAREGLLKCCQRRYATPELLLLITTTPVGVCVSRVCVSLGPLLPPSLPQHLLRMGGGDLGSVLVLKSKISRFVCLYGDGVRQSLIVRYLLCVCI